MACLRVGAYARNCSENLTFKRNSLKSLSSGALKDHLVVSEILECIVSKRGLFSKSNLVVLVLCAVLVVSSGIFKGGGMEEG